MPDSPVTTEGARLLAEVVQRHGAVETGRRLGASEAAVRAWAKGKRAPTGPSRAAMAREFGIPTEAWNPTPTPNAPPPLGQESPASPAAPLASPGPLAGAPGPAAPRGEATATPLEEPRELAHRLVARIECELAHAQGNASYTPRERATLATAATSALRLYARLAGSLEVSQAAIVRSAAWGRIVRAFETTFAKYPEAAKALAEFSDALRELGE